MGRAAIIEVLRHYFGTQPVLKNWLFGSFFCEERKLPVAMLASSYRWT